MIGIIQETLPSSLLFCLLLDSISPSDGQPPGYAHIRRETRLYRLQALFDPVLVPTFATNK